METNLAEAERRIEEARRTGAESLDLGDLALNELPASLGKLLSLKVLHLGIGRLNEAGEPEWDGDRERPVFTDLKPLAGLRSLHSLDLAGCYEVTDLSPLSGLAGLQSLDLSNTKVTDLSPLSGLAGLQSLDLSNTKVTDLSPLSGLGGLQSLSLSGTGVTDLSPLSSLQELQSLELWTMGVTDLSPLSGLQALRHLTLSGKGVAALSPLSDLQGLQSLNLSGTGVTDLRPLAGLRELQSLDLWNTGVTDLSPLSGLLELQRLNLWDTGVTDLSPLAGLERLQNLNLYDCQGVTALSPLSGLQRLQKLDLKGTGVADLSPVSNLKGLQSLNLSDCKEVIDLSPLAGLQILQSLDLSGTGVKDLSFLKNLDRLQYLSFGRTGVTDLSPLVGLYDLQQLACDSLGVSDLSPLVGLQRLQGFYIVGCGKVKDLSPLASLHRLRRLNLSGTGVTNLSPLAELCGLQTLSIGWTTIQDLSPLAGLQGLKALDIFGCRPQLPVSLLRIIEDLPHLTELNVDQASDVPPEILSHHRSDDCLSRLRTYFSELDLGSEVENEVKVILLGNGRVGKTQLCRRFRDQPFDDSVPSTHGVQIWREELQIRTGSEEQLFQVNWWDFGGQDIYHGTHALFLRSRAVFLILWTPTLENRDEYIENGIPMRNQPVAYWLDYVRSLAGEGSPVIVVQSQCDRFSDRRPDPPRPEGFELFECCAYSAKEDRGREILEGQLRNAIGFLLERNGALQIGKGRAEVRQKLYEWRAKDQGLSPEKRQHRTLTLDEFRALCDEAGGIVSWEHALDYFHHTGVVFYQPDLFDSRIILDQDWALDAVYAVFHRGQAMPWLRNSGRFMREDLAATVWQSYSPDEQRLFLGLMTSCGVCFSYRKTFQEEARYVAPDLLPGFEAVSDRVYLVWDETRDTKTLGLKYRFFHPAVIRSLMSEVGQRAGDLAEYWKYGLWFKDGRWNAQLLIQFKDTSTEDTPGAGVLELKAQGHDPLGLLREIRKEIRWRHIGEQPEELLTLDGVTVARSALSTVIDGQMLDIRGESVSAAAFAAFFEGREYQPDEDRSTEKTSGIDINPQPLTSAEKPREIFISYAWGDDSPEGKRRAQAVDGLYAALAKDGFRPVRDLNEMRPGDLISSFIRQLTRADLVVAVISEKYLRSTYCMQEIYRLWQRCQEDPSELSKCLVSIVLPEVQIGGLEERAVYQRYWVERARKLEALLRDPDLNPGPEAVKEVRLVREFAQNVDSILAYLQDVLMSRDLEAHLADDFEAVREALRRRVGGPP